MRTSWKFAAVLVTATLAGCATKGEVEDLRKQVAANESSARQSGTDIKSLDEKVAAHENKLLGHDARLAEAEKSLALATKQISEAGERHAALAQTQSQIAKELADVDARLKALGESIAKAAGQVEKNEAQITNLNAQTRTWAEDLKAIKEETLRLNTAIGKANTMYRKSLENLRDIYKRQFDAVSEILEKEKE